MPTTQEIAAANDRLRTNFVGGLRERIVLTAGVDIRPDTAEIVTAVREYKDFNRANDPHEEHDFGSFEVNGNRYFFKIDYYDEKFEKGLDPYHEDRVYRCLTIMRAEEY